MRSLSPTARNSNCHSADYSAKHAATACGCRVLGSRSLERLDDAKVEWGLLRRCSQGCGSRRAAESACIALLDSCGFDLPFSETLSLNDVFIDALGKRQWYCSAPPARRDGIEVEQRKLTANTSRPVIHALDQHSPRLPEIRQTPALRHSVAPPAARRPAAGAAHVSSGSFRCDRPE